MQRHLLLIPQLSNASLKHFWVGLKLSYDIQHPFCDLSIFLYGFFKKSLK